MTRQEYARKTLEAAGVENASQEARWMVELLPDGAPDSCLEEWVQRRCAGEPFQYIVGSVEFYTVTLSVGPGVLIPRPETELLVERGLEVLNSAAPGSRVLDLCTGSGAIVLAMAHERPDFDYTGVDLSPEALQWAQRNLAALKPPRCRFLQGDLFTPLGTPSPTFQLITANPPYITPDEYRQLPAVVHDYEPRMALEAEDNGLALEFAIADLARQWLAPGGTLLMEMGCLQGNDIADKLNSLGYTKVTIHPDLAGLDRFAEAHWEP